MASTVHIDHTKPAKTEPTPDTATAERKTGGSGPLIKRAVGAVVALCLLSAAIIGVWVVVNHKPSPMPTVDEFLAVVKSADLDKFASMTVGTDQSNEMVERTRQFEQQFPKVIPIAKETISKLRFKTGKPAIKGDIATVPVDMSLPGSKVASAELELKWVSGQWKLTDRNQDFGTAVNSLIGPVLMQSGIFDGVLQAFKNGTLNINDYVKAK